MKVCWQSKLYNIGQSSSLVEIFVNKMDYWLIQTRSERDTQIDMMHYIKKCDASNFKQIRVKD